MPQTGYTPIQLYRTTTAAAQPVAGNLTDGELGINLTDEKLYFKNASGTVKLLASTAAAALGAYTFTGTGTVIALATGPTLTDPVLGNSTVSGIKTATFNSQTTIATTSGSITVNWTTAQNQKQTEPTGTITYTFTAPPGPCHLQLLIDSDGTSTAQTINWPGTVIWLTQTWAGVNNKKAVINFWYDGTNYYAIGSNQV